MQTAGLAKLRFHRGPREIRLVNVLHEELKPNQEFSAKDITQKVFRIQKSVKAFRIDKIVL